MIEFFADNRWQPLLGHGCSTLEEAREYVSMSNSLRLAGDTSVPDPIKPKEKTLDEIYAAHDDAGKARMIENIKVILEALNKP